MKESPQFIWKMIQILNIPVGIALLVRVVFKDTDTMCLVIYIVSKDGPGNPTVIISTSEARCN